MKVSTAYISTAHSVSYKPRTNDEKPPDRHVDIDCSRLNWPAKKVVIAPTTAPSMMPTKGTTIDEVTATRRSTPKKIIVPMKANTEATSRSEEHTSELQSRGHLVCRLLLEKKKKN